MLAQSALWVGLLYDDAALARPRRWCASQPWDQYRGAARRGAAPGARCAVAPAARCGICARRVVAIARDGLRARSSIDARRNDEAIYLAPLEQSLAGGPTQAEYWLERYHGEWARRRARIFAEAAI